MSSAAMTKVLARAMWSCAAMLTPRIQGKKKPWAQKLSSSSQVNRSNSAFKTCANSAFEAVAKSAFKAGTNSAFEAGVNNSVFKSGVANMGFRFRANF